MGVPAYNELMDTRIKSLKVAIAAMILLPLSLSAGPIYHWVDDDGVHHYTESPPPEKSDEVSTVAVDDTLPQDYEPDQDIYNVAQTTERTQAIREDMEEKREKSREDRSRQASQPVVVVQQQASPYASNWWGGSPGYPNRPPVKPELPIAPPEPVEPPYSVPFDPPGRRD